MKMMVYLMCFSLLMVTIAITIEAANDNVNDYDIVCKGTYTLNADYSITATAEGEISGDDIEITMEGELNTCTGQGSGTYEMTRGYCQINCV